MRSACEHRHVLANTIFSNEILNVPQSLCKAPDIMYHGSKADIAKRFSEFSVENIPNCGDKCAIIIEMSP